MMEATGIFIGWLVTFAVFIGRQLAAAGAEETPEEMEESGNWMQEQ